MSQKDIRVVEATRIRQLPDRKRAIELARKQRESVPTDEEVWVNKETQQEVIAVPLGRSLLLVTVKEQVDAGELAEVWTTNPQAFLQKFIRK